MSANRSSTNAVEMPQPAAGGGIESALARVLQVGTYVSMTLITIGFLLHIAGGGSPTAPGQPLVLETLIVDLFALKPEAVLWLGVLVLLATPSLRVVGALIGFWRNGERRMVIVAVLILVVVGIGVVAGLVTG